MRSSFPRVVICPCLIAVRFTSAQRCFSWMRSPAEVLALELRMMETMLERSGKMGNLPGVGEAYAGFLGARPCTLDCPREEILLSPPPSYIFVMNRELYGVYPTPTAVYIRKPLERGEDMMVLHPGYQNTTTVVHCYRKSQLLVLCEENRKLIQYDLSDESGDQRTTTEVLGLPKTTSHNQGASQLLPTDDFVFLIFPSGHLFCIDRLDMRYAAQAKLIRTDCANVGGARSLLTVQGNSKAVQLVVSGYRRCQLVTLTLKQRKCPLYFDQATRSFDPTVKFGKDIDEIMSIQDVGDNHLSVMTRSVRGIGAGPRLYLCNRSLRPLGGPLGLPDSYQQMRDVQVVVGEHDVVYLFREESTLAESYVEAESDSESAHRSDVQAKHKADNSKPHRLAKHYVYRCASEATEFNN